MNKQRLYDSLIVVDDPVKNAETADSPRYKEMLEKFFGETLYTRLMPNGVIVVMTTRWREDDLIGYILRNFDEWEYINVPAVVEEQDLGSVGALGVCSVRTVAKSIGYVTLSSSVLTTVPV